MKRINIVKYIFMSFLIVSGKTYGQSTIITKTTAQEGNLISLKNPNKGFWSDTPASHWYDALVSGNGKMGVLVFGNPNEERIIFNHEFLYEYIGSENIEPPVIRKYLDETRNLMLAGKYKEAINYSYTKSIKEGYPGLLWTDPYHPAFALSINQPKNGNVENYKRIVNFSTGEIIVKWSDDKGNWERTIFVSRSDNVVIQRIKNLSNKKVNCSLRIEHQEGEIEDRTTYITGSAELLINQPEIKHDENWMTFSLGYSKTLRGYEGITKIITKGNAKKEIKNNHIFISDADEILLFTRINYLENQNLSLIKDTKKSLNKLPQDYDKLIKPHAKIHGEMFSRSGVQFNNELRSNLSIEKLFKKQESMPNQILPELLDKTYQMGKYVLISSSGDNPPNLVGNWTGDWRPTWCGDFTLDANVNLQVAGVNTLGLDECLDSYLKMIERIAPDWEINANNLFGFRGYVSGARTSGRRNLNTHFHEGFPGQFWIAGAQWLIYPAFEYYLCTGDKEFLKNRLLPMMEKVVAFYEDFLKIKDKNGKVVFVPSYSPENMPSNQNTTGSINATMDIAASKQAFTNIIFAYTELGMEKDPKIKRWKTLLNSFPPYLVNKDGALKEWAHIDFEDNYNHRHGSHLYGVWPSHEINPDEFPELTKAAKIALEKRGDGDLSTHGIVMKSLAASRLKMNNYLGKKVAQFLSGRFMNRSMITNHYPDGEIYNCDGISSFPGVINEMLIYSKPGQIELLPALPNQLKKGKAFGIRCRSKLIIEKLEWDLDNNKILCKIKSLENQEITIKYRKGIKAFFISNIKSFESIINNTTVNIKLKKGETKSFDILAI